MRDHSAEILFQSFLRDIIVSSSGIGRDVHSLALSSQQFFCRPRRRPPSKVPRGMVWESLLQRVTCPKHAVCWRKKNNNNKKERKKRNLISFHLIYPLTARVVRAPQMISQPVSSFFPCSPLPSGTWRTPGRSSP